MSPIKGGASTDPRAVPALMMPIAVARWFAGSHSATTRVAAGKAAPSPMPSSRRASTSRGSPCAKPCRAQATDHHAMLMANPTLVPMVSRNFPPPA